MAGINHLREIYESRGDDFLKNLLNNYVIINEKTDGSFFGTKKDQKTDRFKYFKKNGEITYVDRVLTKYYNAAVAHFQNLPAEKVERIPSNLFFGFQYLTAKDDSGGKYERLSKNQLTLVYIHKLDEKGETIETYQTSKDLNKWADFLEVERPPIIFEGMLDDEQKTAILDFVYAPLETLEDRFKTDSFTKYIIKLLNPEERPSYLMDGVNGDIDSIVFRFYDETQENPKAETFLAKLVDPMFQNREETQEKPRENRSNDYIWLILIDLMNFIEVYPTAKLKEYCGSEPTQDFEKRYVNMMNCIFKDFIEKTSSKYEGLMLDTPEYLKRDEFAVNFDLINDKDIKRLIKNNDTYKEIYRISINFFNKTRKRASSGFFTPDLINQLNLQVNKIKNIIMGDEIYEGLFPSFNEFVGTDNDDSYLISEDTFSKKQDSLKKAKLVNVIIDEFQPITLGHIKSAEKLKDANGHKVIFIAVKKGKPTKKAPISASSVKTLMIKVKTEYSDLVEDIKMVTASQIEDVIKALRPEYELCLLGTTSKRVKDYLLQLDHIKKRDIPLSLSKKFKLVEVPAFGESNDVIKLIKDSDYKGYKELVPKSIASEFFNLQKEIAPDLVNESIELEKPESEIDEESIITNPEIADEDFDQIIDEQNFGMMAMPINPLQTTKYTQKAIKALSELTFDETVDLFSAAIDGIPGIGTVASAVLDVSHALSYGVRYYLAKDDESKLINATMGIVTLATTLIPVGGNVSNIIASQGIKKVMKSTPAVIKKLLGMPAALQLSKSMWKYCIVALLFRIAKQQASAYLATAREKLVRVEDGTILRFLTLDARTSIYAVIQLVKELEEIIGQCSPNYTELDKQI